MTGEWKGFFIYIMSAFGKGGIPEDAMVALTSQEKKVLGFLILMAGLGLAVLGLKRLASPKTAMGGPAFSATPLSKVP